MSSETQKLLTSDRIETALVTLAVLAFGIVLGVRWAAVDGINTLLTNGYARNGVPALLAPVYNQQMKMGMVAWAAFLFAHLGYVRLWRDDE